MSAIHVPDAVHICPGCEELTSGDVYCERCGRAASAPRMRLRGMATAFVLEIAGAVACWGIWLFLRSIL